MVKSEKGFLMEPILLLADEHYDDVFPSLALARAHRMHNRKNLNLFKYFFSHFHTYLVYGQTCLLRTTIIERT